MRYTIQPVTDYTIFTTPPNARKGIQFQATWTQTLKNLDKELDYLDATDVVLELAVTATDVRLDGMLRATAKVGHPGVRMSFQSRHGALSYTCDTYEGRWSGQMPDWQANVRAIVLTLTALRAVDRYGATKGEQYTGFKALPAGNGTTALGGMTRDQAEQWITDWGGADGNIRTRYRRARAAAHPDRSGDRSAWDGIEQAAKALGLT